MQSIQSHRKAFLPPISSITPLARPSSARPSSARRRGATLVEFALVVPLLLLLTLGLIQFGIVLNKRLSLSNTMRQVARYGAVNASKPSADDLIRSYAISTASSYGLTLRPADVEIGPPLENTADEPKNRERYVTQLPISLSYDMTPNIFIPLDFFGSTVLFNREARYDVRVMVE